MTTKMNYNKITDYLSKEKLEDSWKELKIRLMFENSANM